MSRKNSTKKNMSYRNKNGKNFLIFVAPPPSPPPQPAQYNYSLGLKPLEIF